MKNFSKLFLASLLAGSLIMTGCGESNPTGADVSGEPTDEQQKENTFVIKGRIIPTDGYVAKNAKFVVSIKDSSNNSPCDPFEAVEFTFSNLKTGNYTLIANETSNGKYISNSIKVSITDSNKEDVEITMEYTGDIPKFTFKGEVVDNQNQGLKFAQVSVTNGAIKKDANTNPDNGKFTLENLTPGDYTMTVKADSCEEKIIKSFSIDETGTNTIFDNNKISSFDLGKIKLQPKYTDSGSLEGILTDPATGKAVAQGTKIYIYMRNNDPTIKPSLLTSFITEDDTGYFSLGSLAADYYAGSIGEVTAWDISTDKEGNPLSYNVPTNQQCFNWIRVTEGSYSKIPGFNK